MDSLIPVIVVLPLLAFWTWMFWDMSNNDNLTRWMFWNVANGDDLASRRLNWILAFVLMNVFGAAIYYSTAYRNRHC